MTFNDNAQLDTSQVSVGGSGGGGIGGGPVVGGVGGVIMLILMVLFGGNLTGSGGGTGTGGGAGFNPMDTSQVAGSNSSVADSIAQCRTGKDANDNDTCLIVGTVNSVQDFWNGYLPRYGQSYTPVKTIIYSGSTPTACGTGSSAMGPFYCPLDQKVYIDASFFQELTSKYGADDGQLAQEYVLAHEYGHHIQNIFGVLDKAQQDPQGAQSASVRTELQADCYAGIWVHYATTTKDASGQALLKPITEQDITSALSAASAVGDDRIQQKAQGRVTPESWTHGSSAERQKWFMAGYSSGDLNKCDTFNAQDLG